MTFYRMTALVACFTLFPGAAMAYVGPGAGLGAIGALLALIGTLFLALVGFVWYPVKRVLRRRSQQAEDGAGEAAPGEPEN